MSARTWNILGLVLLIAAPGFPQAPGPGAPAAEPAPPSLAAKAPGAPGYGLVLTTPSGKLLFTNLSFDPTTLRPMARFYLIWGPAGWGPYRSGFEGHLSQNPKGYGPGLHSVWYQNHFVAYGTPENSPAGKSGLDVNSPFFAMDRVDGHSFGWDPEALTYYITQRPAIEVEAIKLPVLFGPSHTTRTVTNQRIPNPPDPADAELRPFKAQDEVVRPLLGNHGLWKELLVARSRQPRFAPLAIQIEGQPRWAVLAQGPLSQDATPRSPQVLEIWRANPQEGAFDSGLETVLQGLPEGPRPGSLMKVASRWFTLRQLVQDPGTGALTALELQPWEASIPSLLAGEAAAPGASSLDPAGREALEQLANDALLEWKTLTFPTELGTLDVNGVGHLVVRLEKAVLALDLGVKGIRNHLDAAARATADWKAQAELAAKEGKPIPAALPPPAESERLADLLDQRKAILMAILGSAKQALANLRR